jgi:thiamine biosynthesis lipoprotein
VTDVSLRPPPDRTRPYGLVEFRAMASPCRIVADDLELAQEGERLVHDLERRWSRFVPDSEVSSLNRNAGNVCIVSAETLDLLERAEFARVRTNGLFNPFVLDRLDALGLGQAPTDDGSSVGPLTAAPIDVDPILIMREASAVRLPPGYGFDPGGIGKGLTGDLVAEHLLSLGATTVQIELGGDVRLAGENWTGGRWVVTVRDPRDRSTPLTTVNVAEGGVATSSPLGRMWQVGGRPVHHLIDPRTGWPCDTELDFVTATSSELWWAEVVAKAALIIGPSHADDLMRELGTSGVVGYNNGALLSVLHDSREKGSDT